MLTKIPSFQSLNIQLTPQERSNIIKPIFFHLNQEKDTHALKELLNQYPHITIHDAINSQLKELVKSLHPKKKFTTEELKEAAKNHIGKTPLQEYGCWVYYPWSYRLVHILDKEEFIDLRTNRNLYKITKEEREILATKKIGIIGLSVGQSTALTLAMERGFGELRLADFDVLELSNLNRIRSGLHNMEVKKVIIAAREIAEIDPYLKVICFEEGLTEETIDDFFTNNGKLDLLIEECDGLDIKILARNKAKTLKIPVVMDTSDRGLLDIERFDLEPNRPILHGLIGDLDPKKIKGLTNEEKVPYLLPMVGSEKLSSRMKTSMIEVEQSITTWPQLASSVVLGGALGADVCRRILLDQFHESGRYYVDMEELIADKEKLTIETTPLTFLSPLTETEMLGLISSYNLTPIPKQLDLSKNKINTLVEAATMAPTGANSQSWQWMYHNKTLYLFFEKIYDAALLDPDNTTSLTGLGAAAENLILKAHQIQLEVLMQTPTLNKHSKLIAAFQFFNNPTSEIKEKIEPHICDELVDIIPHRLTNRNIGKRQLIDKSKFEYLQTIAKTISGAELHIVDDEERLQELGELTAKMDRIRMTSQTGQQDLRAEVRWTKEEVEKTRNGIDILGTADLTPSEFIGLKMIRDWEIVKPLNEWKLGTAFEKIQRKCVAASSALGLITMPKYGNNEFYEGGRALERVWLAANQQGIQVHPASISVLVFNMLLYGNKKVLPEHMAKEALLLREQFLQLFSIPPTLGQILLLRFFISGPPKARSIRYPIKQILHFGE